jgi:hypothetical protein
VTTMKDSPVGDQLTCSSGRNVSRALEGNKAVHDKHVPPRQDCAF